MIVMAELPGISAHMVRFARSVREAGFTVWMPALFGTEGGPMTIAGGVSTLVRVCISREFRREGEPTRRALDKILTFFRTRLCAEEPNGES